MLTATQRRLIAQLDEFYAEASVARDQLQSLEVSAETARESLRLTRLRYTAGEATVLEVVDAQNSLTNAELAREDGTVRYETALANLQILTGTI
jgi:outer membrane protein TolC